MIAHEHATDSFTYESFESLESVHAWMCGVTHNSNRAAYMVDTSTLRDTCVSPLVFDLEWLSGDDLPDRVAGERLRAVQTGAVQALGPLLPHNTKIQIEIEDRCVRCTNDGPYRNSFRVLI